MLITFFTSFCLFFTVTLIIFWPFINNWELPAIISKYKSCLVGVTFGFAGIYVAAFSINFSYGILINSRIILLLFGGLLGGPIAIVISGGMMGISRFFMANLSEATIIFSINFLVIVIAVTYASQIIRINKYTISTYFWIIVSEVALMLLFRFKFDIISIKMVAYFIAFCFVAFYVTYYVIQEISRANQTVERTNHLARVDYLTQLPNSLVVEEAIKQLLLENRNFTLLHIDIDNFKQINLNYSYTTGDEVLRQVAHILDEYAKKNGAFVGRIGGEEFIVLLKDFAPAYAILEADSINKFIIGYEFETQTELKLSITTSIGLSSSPDNGMNLVSLFKSATEAQRRAKKLNSNSYYHANSLKHEAH